MVIMSPEDVTDAIEQMRGTYKGVDENDHINADDEKNAIILGLEGHATGKDQIVISNGPDNQLRFNPNGSIYHNYKQIADSESITRLMTMYMIQVINELDRQTELRKEQDATDANYKVATAFASSGFVSSVACITAMCLGDMSPALCKEFAVLVIDLMKGTEYETLFNMQVNHFENRFVYEFKAEDE